MILKECWPIFFAVAEVLVKVAAGVTVKTIVPKIFLVEVHILRTVKVAAFLL